MMSRTLLSIRSTVTTLRCSRISIRSLSKDTSAQSDEKKQRIPHSDPEVEHHSKLSAEWWDPLGPLKGLHAMNSIRVPLVRDGLITAGSVDPALQNTAKVLKNQKILEVGCGGGVLTESLARLHADVTAIDLSEPLIRVAKEHLATCSPELSSRITYKVEPLNIHTMDNLEKYDAVVVSEVIEHIDDKAGFLTACVDTLKPGGSIFITTLNRTPVMWFTGIILAEYVLNLVPKNTHHWDKLISPLEMIRILNALNCNTVQLKGCIYEFWSNKWLWIPFDSFSYAMQAIKSEKPL